jgi:predicted ATPase/tRNA A-37 threonylcarbamoyl transferase component Bud32
MESFKLGDLSYRVVDRLGRGGTCEVFQIECLQTQQVYALKVLLSAANARRFRREFRSMTRLNHPNIAKVFEYGEYLERPCYSMEFISGGDMKEWLKNKMGIVSTGYGRAPDTEDEFRRIAGLFVKICLPLCYIHAKKILHRDLKPANIMLTRTGDVKLMDFGLIKEMDIIQETLTRTGMFVGTVAYMSPEQGMGRHLDQRSDLYSLGVILYESLTGRLPFLGTSVVEVLMKHINTPPEPPAKLNPVIPLTLQKLALALLQKEPSDRFPSAELVLEHLNSFLGKDSAIGLETIETVADAADTDGASVSLHGLLVPGLIGRENQLDMVQSALDDLERNRPSVLSVSGELGIGKTAFVNEAGTSARIQGVSLLRGACSEMEHFPFSAFLRPLESIADRLVSKDQTFNRKILDDLGPVLASICPAFSRLLPSERTIPIEPLEPEREKLRTFNAIQTVLENFAGADRLVLILEDLHWADDLSFELIYYLARNLCRPNRDPPAIMMMVTWRSEDIPKTGMGSRFRKNLAVLDIYTCIVLEPLDIAQTGRMIQAMLGARKLDASVVQEVHRDSGGNPFFIEEILKNLLEQNILLKKSGEWVLDFSETSDGIPVLASESLLSTAISVPDRIKEIISQRLERLDDAHQRNLQIAAVIGAQFSFDLLQAVSKEDEDALLDQIDNAMREDIVDEVPGYGGEIFRFRQHMFRQVLYRSLSVKRAARIHRKIAEVLEQKFGSDNPDQWEILAYHYDRAGLKREAMRYYIYAGDRAVTFSADMTLHYANRALELFDELGEEDESIVERKLRALKIIGRANELMGNLQEAETSYGLLLECSQQYKNDFYKAIGLQYLGGLSTDRGDYDQAIQMYADALKTATQIDSQLIGNQSDEQKIDLTNKKAVDTKVLLGNLLANIAGVYMNQGKYRESLKTLAIVRKKMDAIGATSGVAMCELNQGLNHYYLGEYAEALKHLTLSVEMYKKINHQYPAVKALNNIGGIRNTIGDTLKATECFSQALEMARKIGDLYTIGATQGNLGVVYQERGCFNQAATSLNEALSISRKLGDRPGIATYLINLATIRFEQGELLQSHCMLEEAHSIAVKMGDRLLTVYALMSLGDLFLRCGDPAASETYFLEGGNIAADIGIKSQQLISQANLIWIKATQDKPENAIVGAEIVVQAADRLGDFDAILNNRYRLAEIHLMCGNDDLVRRVSAPGLRLACRRGHVTYKLLFLSCIGRSWLDREDYRRASLSFKLIVRLFQTLQKELEMDYQLTFFRQPRVRRLLEDIRETSEHLQQSDIWAVVKKFLKLGDL